MTRSNTNPRSGIRTAISPRQNGLLTQLVAAVDSCFCLIRPHRHTQAEIGPRALCGLPFTTKTGAKHPFIKAPASHDTRGSCWLCVRNLTDCGFMFECHFLLLYVNSFQLVTKEKTFQAVFEKVDLAGVQ